MGRMAIVAGIGMVLAAACWLVLANGNPPPPSLPSTPSPAPSAPAVAAPAGAEAGAATDAAATARSAPEPEAASDVPAVPADAKWVDVLVVDKATEQPVAGAEAWWTDGTQWMLVAKLPPTERDAAYRDREGIARRFGWHARSDREGRLRVNLGDRNGTQLFARADTRYGETLLRAENSGKEARRVVIEEDASLSVRVLDAAGRLVAGVPLSLEVHDAKQTRPMWIGGELTSGADGIATFRHVQSRRMHHSGDQSGQPVAQWRVWVGIPGIELAPVLVDAQAPPSEPVEIRLPPTGRLRAKVTFDGRPVPGLEYMSFHAGPKDASDAYNSAWTKRIDADGWVRFPAVPLGKTLFLNANGGGSLDLEVMGPTVVDQEVVASFELASEVIALVGRLLRADGTPVASTGVMGTFDAWISRGGLQVNTDDVGRFVFVLGRPRPENTTELKLRRLVLELRSADATAQRVEVPPRDLVSGTNDLGDLRFGIAQLVVGGRLVFDTPGPTRPWIQVQRANAAPARGGGETLRWEGVDGLQPDVREDGSFEVRGTVAAGRHRLYVQPYGCLPVEPVEFAVGATDVAIAIRRGSPLAATCLLPPGLDAQRVIVRLQRPGASAPPPKDDDWFRRREDSLRGQGWEDAGQTKYRWPALESDTYVLRVESPGFAEPLFTVPDVVVPAPEGGDPRLAPLDLRDAIAALRVKVQLPPSNDEQRDRGRSIYVFPQPQADDREWTGAQTSGEAVLAVPKRPIDLVIAKSGLRPATVRGATGSVAVTLEPWPTVEVRVLGVEALPAGAELSLFARAPSKPKRDTRRYACEYSSGGLDNLLEATSQGSAVVSNGVATLTLGDGAFDLGVYLALEKRGRGASLKQFTPNQIVAGAPVTVQLDADEIRATVEKLQQQAAPAKK